MKKLFVILAVLVWTVPAFAQVDFSMSYDEGTDQLTISYNVVSGDNPSGIALRLNVDAVEGLNDVTSTGSSGAEVISATGGDDFLIYLDYAWNEEDSGDGYQLNEGHPLAKWIDVPGVDKGLPTLPAAKVALCMGHLRDSVSDPDYSGPASDDIAVVQLNAAGDATTIVIDVDADRGGVVGSPLTTNLPVEITTPTGPTDPFYVGLVDSFGYTVVQADVDKWNAYGKPPCWAYTCHANGDANGDCVNTTIDLFLVIDAGGAGFNVPDATCSQNYCCADVNYDGVLTTIDLFRVIDAGGAGFLVCPIGMPPCEVVDPPFS
jgi:hypothetical protein